MSASRRHMYGALAAFALTFVFHVVMIPSQGITDDDDFYAPAAHSYFGFFKKAIAHPIDQFSQPAVDAAFRINHEHPPFAKYVMGAVQWLFHDVTGLLNALDGARAGVALLAALLCAAMYFASVRAFKSEAVGALSVLLLFTLPRFVFHSEVATLDVAVAAMSFLTIAAYFETTESAPRSARWRLAADVICAVVFALALLTKLNAPFVALGCALFFAATVWRKLRIELTANPVVDIPLPSRALVLMAIVGPLLFVVLWPWLWFDTIARLSGYFAFHLKHYPILFFYDGVIYDTPFAPWHASFVMALAAMPSATAILVVIGAARGIAACFALLRAKSDRANSFRALLFIQLAIAIGVVAFSPVPKYGGEKLFMPFFPIACVLAADALIAIARAMTDDLRRQRIAAALLATVVFGAGFINTLRFRHGFALSYYSDLVGSLPGAVLRGYERTYYDVADRELARFLDAQNASVHFLPNHKEYVRTYRLLADDNVISRIKLVPEKSRADIVVLTHERRWSTYPALLKELSTDRSMQVIYEKSVDGVALYTVYRRIGSKQ